MIVSYPIKDIHKDMTITRFIDDVCYADKKLRKILYESETEVDDDVFHLLFFIESSHDKNFIKENYPELLI